MQIRFQFLKSPYRCAGTTYHIQVDLRAPCISQLPAASPGQQRQNVARAADDHNVYRLLHISYVADTCDTQHMVLSNDTS